MQKAFKEVGLIERYGSGIKRILTICKNYGIIAPFFEEIQQGFKVTLFKEKLNDELNDELNKGQYRLYTYIKNNPGTQAKEASVKLNIPFGTIDRHIRVLLKKQYIIRKGSKKTGGYYPTK